MDILVNVRGGGLSGQAGAIRHGISRALIKANPDLRDSLKKAGFLTRDHPRMKERQEVRPSRAARRAPAVQQALIFPAHAALPSSGRVFLYQNTGRRFALRPVKIPAGGSALHTRPLPLPFIRLSTSAHTHAVEIAADGMLEAAGRHGKFQSGLFIAIGCSGP